MLGIRDGIGEPESEEVGDWVVFVDAFAFAVDVFVAVVPVGGAFAIGVAVAGVAVAIAVVPQRWDQQERSPGADTAVDTVGQEWPKDQTPASAAVVGDSEHFPAEMLVEHFAGLYSDY